MGQLRLPGLATGIDTASLIKQLMAINTRRLANYQVQKVEYEARTTLLGELRGKVASLDSAVNAIFDSSNMEAFKASTSNGNVLGVAATEDAGEGSHSVLINQLATSDTWILDTSIFDYETDFVGEGSFVYTYNHQQRVINTTADETTLEDLVNLINDDTENPGVTASLLYQGGKYHLMLSGQKTGEDYQISIDSKYREVWQADSAFTDETVNAALTTKIEDLDQRTETDFNGNETITISGTTHDGSAITSLDLSLNGNTTLAHLIDKINEAFTGVAKATLKDGKIVLTDLTADTSSLSISLQYNKNGSSADLNLPTMAFSTEGGGSLTLPASLDPNTQTYTNTQTAQNAEIRIDDYTPSLVAEKQELTATTLPASGTFTLTFEGQTTVAILANAPTTGAGSIQEALNGLSNVIPGDIVVSGDKLSESGATIFAFLDTAGDVGMISIDPAGLDELDISNYTFTETIKGNDSQWVTSNSNVITEALSGVTLILQDENELDDSQQPIPVTITITRDTAGISAKIGGMVNAYNSLVAYLRAKTMYNPDTKELGELTNDMTASLIKTQLRNTFIGALAGFTEDDIYTKASDIGITMDGHGILKIDNSILNEALSGKNFHSVLELVSANMTGDAISNDKVDFYSGSSKFTTAGNYEVEAVVIDVSGNNVIDTAKIRYQDPDSLEWSSWHNAEIGTGGIITGDSTFDDNGRPLYPENGLQFSVDLTSAGGPFNETFRVKKGFTAELSIMLDDILEETGRIDILEDINTANIESMNNRIAREESRLENVQDRLILKFARLERTLVELQLQMSAVGTLVSSYNI